jgi:hypothetical protein
MPDVDTEAESMRNRRRKSTISTKVAGVDWDALHDAFFSQGDEGTYEGGPARLAASQELAASLEKDARQELARTPQQDARRARAARFVALFLGVQLLILGLAAMRNQHRAFAEAVEDGAATDHSASPAAARSAATRRKPAATPMPAVPAGIDTPAVVDAGSARTHAAQAVSSAAARRASRSQELGPSVGTAGSMRSAPPPTQLAAAKPPDPPPSSASITDRAGIDNPSSTSPPPPPTAPELSKSPNSPPVVRAPSTAAFEPI